MTRVWPFQIIQTPKVIIMIVGLMNRVRWIYLDGRPHTDPEVSELTFNGDSVGHWEGNTLVVDTTSLTSNNEAWGADENLHVIERFTRSGEGTLLYQWTVDNPTAFTKRWKGEYTMTATAAPLFEYACHEGNYALANILKGARAEDQADKTRTLQ